MVRATRFSTIASAFLGALVLGVPIGTAHAQSNWGRYKPGTIAAVMQMHDSAIRADHVANHPGLSGDRALSAIKAFILLPVLPLAPIHGQSIGEQGSVTQNHIAGV